MKILIDAKTNPGTLKTELDVPGGSKTAFHLICDIFAFHLDFENISYKLSELEKGDVRKERCLYRRFKNDAYEIVAVAVSHGDHFIALTGDIESDTAEKFKQHLSALFPNAI